jgi:hypothetical protein
LAESLEEDLVWCAAKGRPSLGFCILLDILGVATWLLLLLLLLLLVELAPGEVGGHVNGSLLLLSSEETSSTGQGKE